MQAGQLHSCSVHSFPRDGAAAAREAGIGWT